MTAFLLSNGFHNSSSTSAKGILLTGRLAPVNASILSGASLVFENAELVVIEVKPLLYGQVGLTISPDSTDRLEADGINLHSLFGTKAKVVNPG